MSEEHDPVVTESILKSTLSAALTSAVNDLEKRLEERITEEGKTSRRHMDVIAERLESHLKLVAEVNVHHGTVLDNHDKRLQKIEKLA
jgi:hypothetical protein